MDNNLPEYVRLLLELKMLKQNRKNCKNLNNYISKIIDLNISLIKIKTGCH